MLHHLNLYKKQPIIKAKLMLKSTMIRNAKITRTLVLITSIACLTIFSVGCTTSQGDLRGQRTDTGVSLAENNYKIIKAGAKGESQGFNLLFLSLVSPNYAEAKSKLYTDIGIPLEGRSVALANQTEDRSCINLIIFSIPKVTITADVIEFTSKIQSESSQKSSRR